MKSKSGKLPNECSQTELLQEIYNQLKDSFPLLPEPSASVLSPAIVYDNNTKKWISQDTAFISTTNQPFMNSQSQIYKNLYTLGTHNGYHDRLMNFTSMESAVINGISLSHLMYPDLKTKYTIYKNKHITDLLFISFIIVCLIVLYYL